MDGTCSSLAYINDVEESIPSSNSDFKTRCMIHIDRVRESYANPIKLYRTLGEMESKNLMTFREVDEDKTLSELSQINCHNGQRKLTLSVLEFLAQALKKDKSEGIKTVVYAGASGLAAVVAAKIFERVRFVLYDKQPNTVDLISKSFSDVVIHRSKHDVPDTSKRIVVYQEWFDDDEAFKFSKMKDILFISDVRGDDTSEIEIARDMRAQQRWAVLTGSEAYMFKFRVPYEWSQEIEEAYNDIEHLEIAAKKIGKKFKSPIKKTSSNDGNEIEYLDGEAHIQLYARPKTAELRLIGFKHKNDTYKTRKFNIAEVENKMATFNAFYRSHAMYWYGRHCKTFFSPNNFAGYDAVSEFAIASQCNSLLGRSTTLVSIKSTLSEISAAIDEFITGKTTPEACSIKTGEKARKPSTRFKELLVECGRKKNQLKGK